MQLSHIIYWQKIYKLLKQIDNLSYYIFPDSYQEELLISDITKLRELRSKINNVLPKKNI